eukprot:1120190-Pyramimonas_sp.AAC.1
MELQGGVAALAKKYIDFWYDPKDQVQWPGRACVGCARIPGMGAARSTLPTWRRASGSRARTSTSCTSSRSTRRGTAPPGSWTGTGTWTPTTWPASR